MKGLWWFVIIGAVIAVWLKNNNTANTAGTTFTGLTPQRGVVGSGTGLY